MKLVKIPEKRMTMKIFRQNDAMSHDGDDIPTARYWFFRLVLMSPFRRWRRQRDSCPCDFYDRSVITPLSDVLS